MCVLAAACYCAFVYPSCLWGRMKIQEVTVTIGKRWKPKNSCNGCGESVTKAAERGRGFGSHFIRSERYRYPSTRSASWAWKQFTLKSWWLHLKRCTWRLWIFVWAISFFPKVKPQIQWPCSGFSKSLAAGANVPIMNLKIQFSFYPHNPFISTASTAWP